MTKTSSEVIAQAHREINVLSVDEEPSTDMTTYGGTMLDGLLASAVTEHGLSFTWDKETVPDGVFLGLSFLLAAHIAPHYERPYQPRAWGWGRFKAAINPDDREDWRDLDDDDSVSQAEIDAGDRAAYY